MTPIVGYNGSIKLDGTSYYITSWAYAQEANELDITGTDTAGVQVSDIANISYTVSVETIFEATSNLIDALDTTNFLVTSLELDFSVGVNFCKFNTVDALSAAVGLVKTASVTLLVGDVVKLTMLLKMSCRPTFGEEVEE